MASEIYPSTYMNWERQIGNPFWAIFRKNFSKAGLVSVVADSISLKMGKKKEAEDRCDVSRPMMLMIVFSFPDEKALTNESRVFLCIR